MRGYRGLQKATDEAVDPSTRQLHTGDLGEIDGDGYLRITGRKKDLIITAGGENVAPTPIENVLCSLIPRCGHLVRDRCPSRASPVFIGFSSIDAQVLIGDRKKYLAALVAPEADEKPPSADDVAAALATYNKSHAKSRAQTVQKCRVLERCFSVDGGELTPTMKVKRAAVIKAYVADVDALYETASLVSYSTENILDVAAAARAAP
jgi:long-subunit acyl-CoA synthetase (AMP-forming)